MKTNRQYLLAFVVLLIIEIIIAVYVHDAFVRPYIGDILVVILIYTLIRGIVRNPIPALPLYVFLFASAVEIAQYFSVAEKLNLHDSRLISIIFGSTFDIKDIICYLIAAIILTSWEKHTNGRCEPE
ncbi:MAG: DUF2809 domain-containing protein [Candidatus Saccharibacteria bacterium]